MASLEFTSTTQTSITVRLTGLDTTSQSNMGSTRLPRHNSYQVSCLGDVRKLSKGSGGNSGTARYTGLAPDTEYEFVATVNFTDVNGNTSDIYIQDFCWTNPVPPKQRPSDWAWQSTVAAGAPINLSASEWNAFCARINAFRDYTDRSAWAFDAVVSGAEISAAIVNDARAAIAPMTNAARPAYINPGDAITAGYFNALRDFLNSVP